VLTGGATTTVSGDINGQTITVSGNGVLALGHDANSATIYVTSPCATVTLAHDFNSGVFNDSATPSGENKVSVVGSTGGETFSGGSLGSGGVFSIGHDGNGASFTFTTSGGGSGGSATGMPAE
jgi:hypothetical protein